MTVIIGQNDQLQEHNHYTYKSVNDSTSWGVPTMSAYKSLGYSEDAYTNNITNAARHGIETRSKNITIKLWKRTA